MGEEQFQELVADIDSILRQLLAFKKKYGTLARVVKDSDLTEQQKATLELKMREIAGI